MPDNTPNFDGSTPVPGYTLFKGKDGMNFYLKGENLDPADAMQRVAKLRAQKSSTTPSTTIPGAPAGLPPMPTAPSQLNMQPVQNNLGNALAGPPLTGMESGLSSPAQTPQNAQAMQTGAIAGGLLTNPITTAGAVGGSVLGGQGARLAAQKLGAGERGQNIAEAGGSLVGGIAGGMGGAKINEPFVNWLTSSKTTGARLLQEASQKAGNAPVELSPKTNELVDKIVETSKLGGKNVKVVSDLLDRLGPSTRQAAQAEPGPLTYNEARILQGNMSQLSAEEQMGLKGSQKGLIKQLAGSFSNDVQAAADKAGIGTEHAAGMREYAMASARNRALAKGAKIAGIGGGAYLAEQGIKKGIEAVKP